MDKSKKILIISIVAAAVVFGAVGYFVGNNKTTAVETAEETSIPTPPVPGEPSSTTTISSTADVTANWKTYTNETYGVSFKYPSNFRTSELTDVPGGLEVSINSENNLKMNNENVNLFNFNWHQNVAEATTLSKFVSGISAASKTDTSVGKYSAVKATNINSSSVDQVVFDADGTIGSFYSRVKMLQDGGAITAAQTTTYNTDFDQIISTFQLTK